MILTLQQIAQGLEFEGFPAQMAESLAGIAISQSGGNTEAVYNTAYPDRPGYSKPKPGNSPEYSVGLFQFNLLAHPNLDSANLVGNTTAQLQAFKTMYDQDGLQPWNGDPVADAIQANGDQPLSSAQLASTQTAGGGTVGGTPASAASAASMAASSTGTNSGVYYAGGQVTDQSDAQTYLTSTLQSWGLPPAAAQWAWGQLTNNNSADQIIINLQQTPWYQEAFPGMALRAKNGLPAMSPAEYLSYADSAIQMAHQVGLPVGFMTKNEIGQLIGNDVSTTELSDRLTGAYQTAIQSPLGVQQDLARMFGAPGAGPQGTTPSDQAAQAKARGALASYYLDPKRSLPLMQNQLTAAQIDYTGAQSGLGNIPTSYAMMLAEQGQTEASTRQGFEQISPLKPLETQLPGQAKQGTVGLTTLLGSQFEGSQPAQRAVQVAEEVRTAPFKGGGGFVVGSKGVAGAGSAGTQGVQGT